MDTSNKSSEGKPVSTEERMTILVLLFTFLGRHGRVITIPAEHAKVSYKDYSLVEAVDGTIVLAPIPKENPPLPFYREANVSDVFIGAAVVLTRIITVSRSNPKIPPHRMIASVGEMRKTASKVNGLSLFLRVDATNGSVTIAVVDKSLGIKNLVDNYKGGRQNDMFRLLDIVL